MNADFIKAPVSSLTYGVDWQLQYPDDVLVSMTAVAVTTGTALVLGYQISGLTSLFTLIDGTDGDTVAVPVVATFKSGAIDQYTVTFAIQET